MLASGHLHRRFINFYFLLVYIAYLKQGSPMISYSVEHFADWAFPDTLKDDVLRLADDSIPDVEMKEVRPLTLLLLLLLILFLRLLLPLSSRARVGTSITHMLIRAGCLAAARRRAFPTRMRRSRSRIACTSCLCS